LSDKRTRAAGGKATEAGMNFQARVGSWFAAQMISASPIGAKFGIDVTAQAMKVRFETGTGMDDNAVDLSTGGILFVQCKTTLSMAAKPDSDFSKVVGQLIETLKAVNDAAGTMPATSVAAVLAVQKGKSAALNDLDSVCRLFQYGAAYADVVAQATEAQSKALSGLTAHVDRIWQDRNGVAPTDDDRAALCRLFRLVRFDGDDNGNDRFEAVGAISQQLFISRVQGEAAWPTVVHLVRGLIQSGAGCARDGFIDAMVVAGAIKRPAPVDGSDVDLLQKWTSRELRRLKRHSELPGTGRPIERACAKSLEAALAGGSLLVTGVPGAGKTGELVGLAMRRVADGKPTVFLSVDSVPDVKSAKGLAEALELSGSITKALKDWPGKDGILFLDALDASRGGASERAFIDLIERTLEDVGDKWSVVASIRTFDLQNGKTFRDLMGGHPPDGQFANPSFSRIRHFEIPLLSRAELDGLDSVSPELADLVAGSDDGVRDLLSNVFNLSLAAQLVIDGKVPADFQGIGTQTSLIEMYEADRIRSHNAKVAVRETVTAMVERQRLMIPQYVIRNGDLEGVIGSGMLIQDGDLIGFAHHILFDHAAGRYFLEWDNVDLLIKQVRGLTDVGFLLGPALQFAQRRLWNKDAVGKPESWRFVSETADGSEVDPILRSVAIRSTTDSVETKADLTGLLRRLNDLTDGNRRLFSVLSRFAAMSLGPKIPPLDEVRAIAWASLARDIAAKNHVAYADGIRILLVALFERVDLEVPTIAQELGHAARGLLALCWRDPQYLDVSIINAVRFVGRTYGTDPVASGALFHQAFDEAHFAKYAHIELPWIAESVATIARYDPAFVVRLYEIAFTRAAPSDQKTWLGGPSQIMGLTSTVAQDYDQARWALKEAFPDFLKLDPVDATRALMLALLGLSAGKEPGLLSGTNEFLKFDQSGVEVLQDRYSLEDWESGRVHASDAAGELLEAFSKYLLDCPAAVFIDIVAIVAKSIAPSSAWNRILGTAAKRPEVNCDPIREVLEDRAFLEKVTWRREVVSLLGAQYSAGTPAERTSLERVLLDGLASSDPDRVYDWNNITRRFFGVIDTDLLQSKELKTVLADMRTASEDMQNRPLVSFSSSVAWSSDDVTAVLLRRAGANLDAEPDASIYAARRRIEELLPANGPVLTAEAIVEVWTATGLLIEAIALGTPQNPNREVLHSAWGAVSNAVEAIVKSEAYSPSAQDHPAIGEMLALIEELAGSEFPEKTDGDSNANMAWGNWDVRVYAAASLIYLIIKAGPGDPHMLDLATKLIRDPVPTVRLQLAQSLNGLWDCAKNWMWALTEQVARHEDHQGVLGFFVSGPLGIMAYEAKERVTELTKIIVQRVGLAPKPDTKPYQLDEGLGHLAAHLWIGLDVADARAWLLEWVSNLPNDEGLVWSYISSIREALFIGFKVSKTARDDELRDRTHFVVSAIVSACAEALAAVKREWKDLTARAGA